MCPLPASRSFSGSLWPPRLASGRPSCISVPHNLTYLAGHVSSYFLLLVLYLRKEKRWWGSERARSISCSVSTVRFYSIYFLFRGCHELFLEGAEAAVCVVKSGTARPVFCQESTSRVAYHWLCLPHNFFFFLFLLIPA